MRRRGVTVIIIAILAAAFVGTWTIAYRMGESDGRDKVSTDRSTFQTRVAGGPQANAGGGLTTGGGATGQAGARGAGGSAVAGNGAQATGVAAAGGSPAAGRTDRTASNITGKVTKVDGTTISVQQNDNSTVSVTTNAQTAVRKLVAGALTDLKAGDLVAIDGTRTGDTAVSAQSVTSLGAAPGGARAQGGGVPAAATAPAVTGQIRSVDGGTITVQGFDGTSVTVTTTPTTVVRMQQPGALSDIKSGDMLLIQGDKTGDAAFLARTITNQGAATG